MKRRNIIIIFLFSTSLFFISFIYGYKRIGKRFETPSPLSEDRGITILQEEERISPNLILEKETYYKECNHNIIELIEVNEDIINLTEEEYREYMAANHPNIKIRFFSANRILIFEEKNHLCPNHFIVGQWEGNIAIFRIDENGERILDRVFKDYPISLLKKIDQEELKEGIRVDNEGELSDVIENFIS